MELNATGAESEDTMSESKVTETPQLACHLPAGARIKLIGLGGIGCVVLHYLAMFLRSLMREVRLVIIDGDRFEPKNMERMDFKSGGNKAEVKAEETLKMLGSCDLSIVPIAEHVNQENVDRLIQEGDYVILCVDNHPTRRLVSERCGKLSNVVLISGGNDGIDPPKEQGTYGNVQIAVRQGGQDATAPITKYHPEIANATGEIPGDGGCGQIVESVPQILFTNLAVASAILNALFAYTCGRLKYQEVQLDILEARSMPQLPIRSDRLPGPGAIA
jgi:hypothetical protein